MRDIEIRKMFNIPVSTLYKFKVREKGDWRRNVYDFLRALTLEEAKEILKRIETKKD